MTSILKVDNIQNSSGTSAMSIDSSGSVSFPNSIIGIGELDHYRLTSDFSTNDAVITGFSRVDDATFSKLGAGITESSGVFTFPITGLWVVLGAFDLQTGSSDTLGYFTETSSDSGSTYDEVAIAYSGHGSGNGTGTTISVVNVQDSSTYRFRSKTISLASGSSIKGSANSSRSSLLFVRVADAQ